MPPSRLALTVANDAQQVPALIDAVADFLGALAVLPEDLEQVLTIVDELAVNVINYAWSDGQAHAFLIVLDVAAQPDGLLLSIATEDDGAPFDPTQAKPPDLSAALEARAVGGLGVFLVRKLSDGMAYARSDGRNRVRVLKALRLAG